MSKTITQFDRTNLRLMRPEIEAALKVLEAQYGISIKLGNAKFTSENVTFKFEMAVVGSNGAAETSERTAFRSYCFMYGFKEEQLGQSFKVGRDTYTVAGLNPKAKSMPVLAKRSDGRMFKFPVNTVTNALKAEVTA